MEGWACHWSNREPDDLLFGFYYTRICAWDSLIKVWFGKDDIRSRRNQIRCLRRKGLEVVKVQMVSGWKAK